MPSLAGLAGVGSNPLALLCIGGLTFAALVAVTYLLLERKEKANEKYAQETYETILEVEEGNPRIAKGCRCADGARNGTVRLGRRNGSAG